MLKLGTYGFLRFGIYLFPEASVYFAPALVALGTIGIIYGAIAATMQRTSSVSSPTPRSPTSASS